MQSLGRYEILQQIGAGAMGAVYRARDPLMGREVAIKTILAHVIEGQQSAEFRDRFFREARAAGRLSHPGIVTMYDVGDQDGAPYLVMEYVEGQTLQSVLETERLQVDQLCDFGIQIAEALDYAHRNNVIHRDIKPANILITSGRRAKIADFGVARIADAHATSTGVFLGTPAFMAPEQFTGSGIDGRADLFAVGVILYWIATGDKPFTGDTILAVQYKIVHSDPVPPRKLNPAISSELETVILKSISKDPAGRYANGRTLANDLHAIRTGAPVSTVLNTQVLNDATVVIDRPATQRTIVSTGSRASKKGIWAARAITVALLSAGAVTMRMRAQKRVAPAQAIVPIAAIPAPPPVPQPPSAVQRQADAQQPPKPVEPQATPAAQKASSPVNRQPNAITLDITAIAPVNLVFHAEGQPTETLGMQPGESSVLRAEKEATLIVNNPAALQARLNGKPMTFGSGGPTQFVITPQGIDESRSAAASGTALASVQPSESSDDTPAARGNRNAIGLALRQRELARAADSVHLLIKSPGLPELLTLIVRADNEMLFRRDPAASPPDGVEGQRRFQFAGVPAIPVSDERLLPPGSHVIQVSLLLGKVRLGPPQEVTADFNARDRHTLSIQLTGAAQRGGQRGASRFTVKLE